jgi:predicted protein tyrosine phosphatase
MVMTKNESAIKPIATVFLLGISCFVVVSIWSAGISRRFETKSIQSQKQVILGNQTQSLEIIKAELNPNGRLIHIAVKNVSNKDIDWFRISLGAGSDVEADFLFAHKSILAPGEVYDDDYPFDSKSNEVRITIVSLLFEDQGSDGDMHYAQLAKDKRSGQRMELNRLVALLHKASEIPRIQQSASVLEHLEIEVGDSTSESRIPAAHSSLQTEARLIGVRTARNRVLNEIQRIKTMREQDRSEELVKLGERYKSINSKLAGYDF